MDTTNFITIAVIGAVAGILSGVLGLGGAIIIIPASVMFLGFSQQMAQGTTLMMMVFPVGGLAAYQYYQNGYVEFKTAIIMAIFFFLGGYFGAKAATLFSAEILQKLFAVMLVAIAVKMFFFPK